MSTSEIARTYLSGSTSHEIAATLGVSVSTVCRRLRAEGVELRAVGRPRTPRGETKTCGRCRRDLPVSSFNGEKTNGGDGLQRWCRSCQAARASDYSKRHRERHPEKVHAREAVRAAVEAGRLIRRTCSVCGSLASEFHHAFGYEKKNWLRGEWLCKPHHREADAKQTKGVANVR